ncbi:MAG: DUF177 domain-containing protein [Proteobacteria bacterium]|nr:DUF177 domain-containing protein [Pseudomonadota bacterium]MBS0572625.1 DUF177 domain-containing protein [Pseudomonadota bacterium]
MQDQQPFSHPIRRAALPQRKPLRFDLAPEAAERTAIAAALGLLDLPHVRLTGEIRPAGRNDFALSARLSADVVQACIVTLDPVAARIDEPVERRYLADWHEPEAEETEMPEDDSIEPLGDVIDLGAVLTEALALALPPYPRAPGAAFSGHVAASDGAEPLTDERMRPFAGLADLLGKAGEGGKTR